MNETETLGSNSVLPLLALLLVLHVWIKPAATAQKAWVYFYALIITVDVLAIADTGLAHVMHGQFVR